MVADVGPTGDSGPGQRVNDAVLEARVNTVGGPRAQSKTSTESVVTGTFIPCSDAIRATAR